jgi:hypothetical protein
MHQNRCKHPSWSESVKKASSSSQTTRIGSTVRPPPRLATEPRTGPSATNWRCARPVCFSNRPGASLHEGALMLIAGSGRLMLLPVNGAGVDRARTSGSIKFDGNRLTRRSPSSTTLARRGCYFRLQRYTDSGSNPVQDNGRDRIARGCSLKGSRRARDCGGLILQAPPRCSRSPSSDRMRSTSYSALTVASATGG